MEPIDPALAPFAIDDAILDPAVDDHLDSYLTTGGDPALASSMLSNSYTGFHDSISLIYEWAQQSQSGDLILHQAIKDIVKHHQATLIPQVNSTLAKQPDHAATIKSLFTSPHWSSFITDLANNHKQTAFYDIITTQAKLPRLGISSDVLTTPQAFINEIMHQLESIFTANTSVSKPQLVHLLKKLSVMCTYDELTTVVSLRLFAELARDARQPHARALYRKASHEIRKEAVKLMTTSSIVPKTIARQYVVRLAINVDCALSNVHIRKPVIDALVTIADCGHRRRFEKEVSILLREYAHLLGDVSVIDSAINIVDKHTVDHNTVEKKVLIQALCHPEVLLDLMKALYSHSCRTYVDGRPDPRKRCCLSLLLSYVSVFINMGDCEIEEQLKSDASKQLLLKSVKDMYDHLNSTAEACEELLPGSARAKIKGKPVEILMNSTRDPLIARGILLWAKECLHGGTDLRSLLATAPKHLVFLEAVASCHEILCEDILLVIYTAFTRDYSGLETTQVNQLRDMFMRTISAMLKFNMGPHVLLTFQRWWVDRGVAKKLDLRNFVAALFQTVSPPYTTSFAVAMNNFLEHNRVLWAIEGDAALSGKVFNFRDATAEVLSKQSGITVA